MFGHIAGVCVKCAWKGLRFAIQRDYARIFMGGIVVADGVNLLVRVSRFIDKAQKLEQFPVAMTLLAQPIDRNSRGA